jgi:hypothetical protein
VTIGGECIDFVDPAKPVKQWPVLDAKITQAQFQHETAQVQVRIPTNAKLWPTWTPVEIAYGVWPWGWKTFYGYIAYYEGRGKQTTNIVCLGASMPMKDQNQQVWKNCTASYIARQLATKYHMAAVIDQSSYVMTSVAQSGMSDFQFLTMLAKQLGYKFFVTGTKLYFIDPARVLARPDTLGPTLWYDTIQNSNMTKWAPVVGDQVADGGTVANRQVAGIDPRTAGIIVATEQYLRTTGYQDASGAAPNITHYDNTVVESLEAAHNTVAGQTATNQFWVQADCATNPGDARLQPGATVDVEGDKVNVDDRGLWMVQGVTHHIVPHLEVLRWFYTCENISLGRDQIWGTSAMPVPPEWNAAVKAVKTLQQNQRWVAEHSGFGDA